MFNFDYKTFSMRCIFFIPCVLWDIFFSLVTGFYKLCCMIDEKGDSFLEKIISGD
jgi:hypothetical protein